ncbi:MAG: LD-carboxypeptidase [Fimbriimonadaceae bacterium]|nr:LD-carboxypeptidase [Chitinophagales bacterium]
MQQFKLKQRDKIGIISTARSIDFSEIEMTERLLKEWGLVPVYGKTIGAKHMQFSGDDETRTEDLQTMLDDNSIRAILFARGGYGTIRIIDKIDFTKFMQYPKLLCGYSDITIIHTHINDKLGLPTVHSTMPFSFQRNTPEAINSLKNILFGDLPQYTIETHPLNVKGNAEGVLIGGNLSILYSLLGTQYGFGTNHKILFIEDIDEYLYHIDRMMMSLKLAGKLKSLNGVIVGDFTDMKDNKVAFGNTAEEIIYAHIKDLGIPVCFNFPCGHIDDNRALIFGKEIKLEVNNSVKLTYK